MPESPAPKPRRHPWESFKAPRGSSVASPSSRRTRPHAPAYAELQAATNFTFLVGASHADELVERTGALGLRALAVTDLHSVAGIVRAHVAAKEAGVPLVVGATVELAGDVSIGDPRGGEDARALSSFANSTAPPTVATRSAFRLRALLHATSRVGYATLCRLLTIGKRRAPKGECRLALHDLLEHHEDLLVTVIPPPILDQHAVETIEGLRAWLNHRGRAPRAPGRGDDRLSIAVARRFDGNDRARLHQLRLLSEHVEVPLVAVNDVLHHAPERQRLQDVLTCIRHGCTVRTAGLRLQANAERHLKGPEEMARLFADLPDALRRSVDLADRAVGFSLDELRYEYPDEVVPPGCTPMDHLRKLTWSGAADRYPGGVPERVRRQIDHEFALVDELGYAPYFLTVHDLCVFARSRGILHQGRGAAANSAVCYCLAVTAVDPDRIDVLFERFVSRERNEPPDIDIDFEHERREEVIQYIYRKYGRERAALTAEVITYRGRSAVRDVGKALGLSLDCVDRLAKGIDWWSSGTVDDRQLRELALRPEDPTVRLLVQLTRELLGFPRHLSQHVGGFVITRGPLCEMVPVENAAMPDRTVIEWDKDDIDAMGMLKVDVLGLGMLTCLRKAMELTSEWKGRRGEGTKGQREVCNGRNSQPSGSACVAAGNATCGGDVRDDSVAAGIRMPRTDKPDEACSGFRSIEYRRGECIEQHGDVSQAASNRTGLARGTGNAVRTGVSLADGRAAAGANAIARRSRSDAPRSDHGPGEASPCAGEWPQSRSSELTDSGRPSVPPSLRPFVPVSLASIPPEDPRVYDMICRADTVGVFQIESRAQMSMLPRLRPRCFYDLVIEVAIVRPGPIQGDMVHPYLRRRDGREPVVFPDDAVRRVLGKTLGVPLFQEQAMSLAIVAAGFTPGEADQLRRAIAAWKSRGNKLAYFGERIVSGMIARGYSSAFAEQCFNQIKGFSGYGFPESHAASFALLVYASAWLKLHHPAAFAAALINSQPMGFYAPAQIVRDAEEHGVTVLPIDVNRSGWDCQM
ncbi:MAG: PHP domain-containing protein, partial [Phycisphaerales bacterium]|nr:PHP domain-containing protein [Phycisphaerales bacterium]